MCGSVRQATVTTFRAANAGLTLSAAQVWSAAVAMSAAEIAAVFRRAAAAPGGGWVVISAERVADGGLGLGVAFAGANWRYLAEAMPYPPKLPDPSAAILRPGTGRVALGVWSSVNRPHEVAAEALARVGVDAAVQPFGAETGFWAN